MDKRDIVQDNLIQGMTLAEKAEVRRLTGNVVQVFAVADAKPEVAFTVLVNVLGNLIGIHLEGERQVYIERAQAMLPLYVEAYRSREKKI